jgi:hypothetical protein
MKVISDEDISDEGHDRRRPLPTKIISDEGPFMTKTISDEG